MKPAQKRVPKHPRPSFRTHVTPIAAGTPPAVTPAAVGNVIFSYSFSKRTFSLNNIIFHFNFLIHLVTLWLERINFPKRKRKEKKNLLIESVLQEHMTLIEEDFGLQPIGEKRDNPLSLNEGNPENEVRHLVEKEYFSF